MTMCLKNKYNLLFVDIEYIDSYRKSWYVAHNTTLRTIHSVDKLFNSESSCCYNQKLNENKKYRISQDVGYIFLLKSHGHHTVNTCTFKGNSTINHKSMFELYTMLLKKCCIFSFFTKSILYPAVCVALHGIHELVWSSVLMY